MKATYTNKTLVRTVYDKRGNKIIESVETVVKFPKSAVQKNIVNLKLKLEELVSKGSISAYSANNLFKIIKNSKVKYKRWHWYIYWDGISEVEDKLVGINKIIDIYGIVYRNKDKYGLEQEQLKKIRDEISDNISHLISSYTNRFDDFSDFVKNIILNNIAYINYYKRMIEQYNEYEHSEFEKNSIASIVSKLNEAKKKLANKKDNENGNVEKAEQQFNIKKAEHKGIITIDFRNWYQEVLLE